MNLALTSEFDLIGQEIEITNSKNEQIIGKSGKVIMETKNMILLDTKNGEKYIPKDICQLSNNNGIIQTDSTKLTKRPHERLEILV
jgi:ribonuclease P protein subunit POP4